MIIVLYILLGLSLFFPVYTYVLYPLLLKLLRDKHYNNDTINPKITAIICFGDGDDSKKIKNLEQVDYSNVQIIVNKNITEAVNQSTGEILVFLDNVTELDKYALVNIVKPFSDERVDMVVGEQTCRDGNSAFWKYETKIKRFESKIGSVSGANNTLFAVRKKKMPNVPSKIKNIPFYISTVIKQNKGDVVYCQEAKTYETKQDAIGFKKHIADASGYWQAFVVFWRMLFPRKGSFVYISHRVMKWFVWLNMILLLSSSIWLSVLMWQWFFFVAIQLFAYLFLIIFKFDNKKSIILRLFAISKYFLFLNISFFLGIFRRGVD